MSYLPRVLGFLPLYSHSPSNILLGTSFSIKTPCPSPKKRLLLGATVDQDCSLHGGPWGAAFLESVDPLCVARDPHPRAGARGRHGTGLSPSLCLPGAAEGAGHPAPTHPSREAGLPVSLTSVSLLSLRHALSQGQTGLPTSPRTGAGVLPLAKIPRGRRGLGASTDEVRCVGRGLGEGWEPEKPRLLLT